MARTGTVFVRDATGLVRSLGFVDQILVSQSMLNVTGFVFAALAMPYWFPGANLPLVLTIGAIPALAMAVTYGIFSAAIPRSGGDYVWTGRILGPRWGAILAIMILIPGNLAYLAQNLWLIDAFGLSQTFVSTGLVTGNPGLVSLGATLATAPTGFIVSLIFVGIIFLIGAFGIDFYKKSLRYSYVFYVFSAILFVAGMLVAASGSYANTFDVVMKGYGITYEQVQTTVNSNPQLASFSLGSSLLAVMPLGFLTYAGFNYNTYMAGEMRNATKTIPRGLILSVLIGLVVMSTLATIAYSSLGGGFIGGISYLFNSGQLTSLPVQPSINFLVSLATPPWMTFLINLNVTVGFTLVALSFTISYSRIIFALAFDRVLPARFATVSDRLHSPYIALIVVSIISAIFTAVWWYTGWAASYLNGAMAINVAYILPGIAAIVFPFVKRDLYKQTVKTLPGWLSAEIGGLPVLSLAGLIVTGAWLFGMYSLLNPGYSFTYLGPNLPYAVGQTLLFVVIGLGIYEFARVYNKRKYGIDIGQIYAEIPPE